MAKSIEQLEEEIRQRRITLKQMKKELDLSERSLKLDSMIKQFEADYPDEVESGLGRQVKAGESFDEWYERWGKHVKSVKAEGIGWAMRYYDICKKPTHRYIKWLIEKDDPKIHNTEAYERMKGVTL